jgi:hypothetical protein
MAIVSAIFGRTTIVRLGFLSGEESSVVVGKCRERLGDPDISLCQIFCHIYGRAGLGVKISNPWEVLVCPLRALGGAPSRDFSAASARLRNQWAFSASPSAEH